MLAYWDTDLIKSVDFLSESLLHITCCLYQYNYCMYVIYANKILFKLSLRYQELTVLYFSYFSARDT